MSNHHQRPTVSSSVCNFFKNEIPCVSKLSIADVDQNVEGLDQLSADGRWRCVVSLCELMLASDSAEKRSLLPDETLQIACRKINALFRIGDIRLAAQEFNSLGPLDAAHLQYQFHPQFYSGKTGSMVPFELHLLRCELLHRQGDTVGSINLLLDYLSDRSNRVERHAVLAKLVSLYFQCQEFHNANHFFHILINESGNSLDPHLLSQLAYLKLEAGDIRGAEIVIKQVESLVVDNASYDCDTLILINKSLLLMAQLQLDLAFDLLQSFLTPTKTQRQDASPEVNSHSLIYPPKSTIAAHNLSICALYTNRLDMAVSILENLVRSDPKNNLTRVLCANLCLLYHHGSSSSRALTKKQVLLELVDLFAADDVDISDLLIEE